MQVCQTAHLPATTCRKPIAHSILLTRSNELKQSQQDAAQNGQALESATQRILTLDGNVLELSSKLESQAESMRDGVAASERSERLEKRLQETSSELARTQSQLRRAASLQTGAENERDRITQQLAARHEVLKELETKNASLVAEMNNERAEKDRAVVRARGATDRCRQAELEQRLLEGVKSQVLCPEKLCDCVYVLGLVSHTVCVGQMMMKVDMLLMTRGEAMDVIELVR